MFVGVDHSTTGVKVAIISDGREETFTLDRALLGDGSISFLNELSDRVDINDINLAAITYSWGDAIETITDIEAVSNRGITDHMGFKQEIGGGTATFDELKESSIPAVVVPGIHDGIDPLHEYFRTYSALAGGDKVADVRYAQEHLRNEGKAGDHFIWACASSSCMSALVCEGELRGFFWWMGLIHGWPDAASLRRIKRGDDSIDDVMMQRGVLHASDKEFGEIFDGPDNNELELAYFATLHNVHSLLPFADELGESPLEGVVLAGRLLDENSSTDLENNSIDLGSKLSHQWTETAPTYHCDPYSATYGVAYIARDVWHGRSVLGIPVGEMPV